VVADRYPRGGGGKKEGDLGNFLGGPDLGQTQKVWEERGNILRGGGRHDPEPPSRRRQILRTPALKGGGGKNVPPYGWFLLLIYGKKEE